MRSFLLALTALLCAVFTPAAFAHDVKAGALEIDHPWSRATAGQAANGAAFMTITNKGATADKLVAAATPAAAKVELHTHVMDGGVMRMREVEGGIDLPAGATVALAPGGLHVMLLGLAQPLKEGEMVPMTLTFRDAGTVAVKVKVESVGFTGAGAAHHGH